MKKFLSKMVCALLLLGLSSQPALIAQPAETKNGRLKQLQETMLNFRKTTTNFIRCMATGKCDSEEQKALTEQVSYWGKRVILLMAVVGTSWAVAAITKRKMVEAADEISKKAAENLLEKAPYLKNPDELIQKMQEAAVKAAVQAADEASKKAAQKMPTQLNFLGMPIVTVESRAEQEAAQRRKSAEYRKVAEIAEREKQKYFAERPELKQTPQEKEEYQKTGLLRGLKHFTRRYQAELQEGYGQTAQEQKEPETLWDWFWGK